MGLPGSGKSTWAHAHYPNFTRIDGDFLKTSEKVCHSLRQSLMAGQNCIVDATNGTLERRSTLIAVAKSFNAVIVGVRFTTDVKTCIERCRLRHESGGNKVPKIAIYKVNKSFVEPNANEGFDALGVTQ